MLNATFFGLPSKPKPKPRKRRKRRKLAVAMPERGPMSKRLPPPPPPDQIVNVALSVKHTINGQIYGPGVVSVPWSIGQTLAENESRNIAEERGLSQKRASIILAGGRTIPVPPDTFEGEGYASLLPASITQGG